MSDLTPTLAALAALDGNHRRAIAADLTDEAITDICGEAQATQDERLRPVYDALSGEAWRREQIEAGRTCNGHRIGLHDSWCPSATAADDGDDPWPTAPATVEEADPDPRLTAVDVRVKATTCYEVDGLGRFVPSRCHFPVPGEGRCSRVITHEVSETAGPGTGYTRCCVWHLDAAVARAIELATDSALRRPPVPPIRERCPQCGNRRAWELSQHTYNNGRTWQCGDCPTF